MIARRAEEIITRGVMRPYTYAANFFVLPDKQMHGNIGEDPFASPVSVEPFLVCQPTEERSSPPSCLHQTTAITGKKKIILLAQELASRTTEALTLILE